jgi:crossover junction endodeoxyribonuclease RuvC
VLLAGDLHCHISPPDDPPHVTRGVVETVLELARLDVRAVQPATWKRWYGLIGSEKADGIEKARALYPLAESHLKRKKDHNRADALLLAHFGQRTMT